MGVELVTRRTSIGERKFVPPTFSTGKSDPPALSLANNERAGCGIVSLRVGGCRHEKEGEGEGGDRGCVSTRVIVGYKLVRESEWKVLRQILPSPN